MKNPLTIDIIEVNKLIIKDKIFHFFLLIKYQNLDL